MVWYGLVSHHLVPHVVLLADVHLHLGLHEGVPGGVGEVGVALIPLALLLGEVGLGGGWWGRRHLLVGVRAQLPPIAAAAPVMGVRLYKFAFV